MEPIHPHLHFYSTSYPIILSTVLKQFHWLGAQSADMTTLIVKEDHERDAAFTKAMHGKSAAQRSTYLAMLNKDSKAQRVAADAYFKHWDNKDARVETQKDREVRFQLWLFSI